jgi:hypothetical protein
MANGGLDNSASPPWPGSRIFRATPPNFPINTLGVTVARGFGVRHDANPFLSRARQKRLAITRHLH